MSPGAPLRPFGRRFVPVPTGEESAAFDRWATRTLGVPETTLMENAGRGAARVVDRLFPTGDVVGFVGSGNNGGDALVALRALAEGGRRVHAVFAGERAEPEPLLHGWPLSLLSGAELQGTLAGACVILDGVLGTGARGAPRERQAEAIRAMNASARPVVALDVPSGVDANDGSAPGESVRAVLTVAFGFPKLGTLLHPGRARAGRIVAVDIGFPPAGDERFGARLVTPVWAAELTPGRALDTHKKAVGVALIVAGGPGMAGAAVLAARGALRAGAGLVRVASHDDNRVVLQTAVPGAIFVSPSEPGAVEGALADSAAVVAGPGLGRSPWAGELLARVFACGRAPLVLDADGLNLAAAGAATRPEALARSRPVLVTPHPGEMARLAPDATDAFRSRRLDAAREWAESARCVLLLKGSPSLVASPGEPVLIDAMGSSDLATAGIGDVLAGVAGALIAQGLSPRLAAARALYACGRAARLAVRGRGLLPEDVVEHLADALAEEGAGATELDPFGVLLDLDAPR
jgi:NAD(P)H-hydrate epimerase